VFHILSVLSRMQSACAMIYCHLWPVRLCHIFPHCYKRHVSQEGGGDIVRKMCFFIFCTILSVTFLIPRRTEGDIVINVNWASCKLAVIPVRF